MLDAKEDLTLTRNIQDRMAIVNAETTVPVQFVNPCSFYHPYFCTQE